MSLGFCSFYYRTVGLIVIALFLGFWKEIRVSFVREVVRENCEFEIKFFIEVFIIGFVV